MQDDVAVTRRPSMLAYQPRRQTPWQAADLLLIVGFHLIVAGTLIVVAASTSFEGTPASEPGPASTEHIVVQLLSKGGPWALVLCIISAAVVAPICEEFFYRVLLQGWLESVVRRLRRKSRALRGGVSAALLPILISSFVFASQHFRTQTPQIEPRRIMVFLAAGMTASLLTLAFAVVFLRLRVGATAADFGWDSKTWRGDIVLGLGAFAVIVAPIYGMQCVLTLFLAPWMAPDPIPLFFFAVALGFLYFRTHRILPLIVLHATFNATGLTLALLSGL